MSKQVHSLNVSPSKQRYSFSKSERFSQLKPPSDCSYLPNIQRNKRSALIGSGQRSLGLIHSQKVYQHVPHAYNIPSTLQQKKGYSLKSGGRYEISGYLHHLIESAKKPGPNSYEQPSYLDHKNFTLKKRIPQKQTSVAPGPGAYTIPSSMNFSDDKKIMQSKFSNPSSLKIHNSLDLSRRKQPTVWQPGPGKYDVNKYGIGNPENPYGKNDSVKFSHAERQSMAKKQNVPGPIYKMYSEFD